MKKRLDPDALFDRQGYVPLKEYTEDLRGFFEHGPWRLPLSQRDRILFFLLRVAAQLSWIAEVLYVQHPFSWSPSYGMLLAYLRKNKIVDVCYERQIASTNYFAYTLIKQIVIGNTTKLLHANGVAESKSVALSKAIGEMLERTITGSGDMNKNIITAPVTKLRHSGKVFYPPQYHRFLPEQKKHFPILCHSEDRPMDWVIGKNSISQERVFIPRHLTSWFFRPNDFTPIFMNPTTNGSALAFTKEAAIFRGALEVIERDAFFVHWLTGIAPEVIDQATLPADLKEQIDSFASRGITIHVLNITTNIPVPSACVMAISSGAKDPGVVVSAASALSFYDAIKGALREMVICAESLCDQVTLIPTSEPFLSELDKNTRLAYWRGDARIRECEWFFSGGSVSYHLLSGGEALGGGSSDPDKLKVLLAILQEAGPGYHPVVYEPDSRLAEKLGCCVAQVFIPKAFPLYLIEKYGTFDSDRLGEFARYKGKDDWKITKIPHMFV